MKRLLAPLLLALIGTLSADTLSPPSPPRLNGIPFYQIYEEKDIENSSRSNFITTAPDGRLFFGCENGLHTFDGTRWKHVLSTPSTQDKIRSLYWTENGVYAAGYGTIGKIDFQNENGIRLQPINDKPLTKYSSEFYSKILRQGDTLYFLGERSVAYLNLATEEYGAIAFDSWVKGSAIYGDKLLLATTRDGILVFEGKDYAPHPAFKEFVDKHVILKIETNPSGETYFTTESNEIYRIAADGQLADYSPFPFQAGGAIRDLEFISEDRLAISVAHKGIYFVNREGRTLSTLARDFDYRWVSANALHLDQNQTLWVQFNSTVGKVIVNSALSQIDERLSTGVEYPIAHEVDGQIYLRTNGRLLKPDFSEHGSLQGFVDTTPELDRSIVAASATRDGIYFQGGKYTHLLQKGIARELGRTGYIERMTPFENDPDTLFAATADSLLVLQRQGEQMKILSEVPHQAGHINKIARAADDTFWLEIGIGQVGRARVQGGAIEYQLFKQESGLPTDWIAVWEHEGEVLFTSSKGIFEFQPRGNAFAKSSIIEAYLPSTGIFHRVATDPKGNIWASYDSFNYILWKQEDGTYLKDSSSLRHVGDQFFNQFKFLSNGDALLLTASELFHVNGSLLAPPRDSPKQGLFLFEVSDIEGSSTYYQNPGHGNNPEKLELASDRRSLSIRVGSTNSATVKVPQYQYLLEGMSSDWSKWSTSNEISFTRLEAGDYTLRVRSRSNESTAPQELTVALSIAPTFFETPLAYLCYILLFLALLYLGYGLFAQNLKKTNFKLEKMVAERTQEIESKNSELQRNANELSTTLEELRSAQDLLMSTSRKAGMAEVATNVLHNVGNVLNSINVALLSLSERLSQERVSKLVRVSKMINEHQDDLADFLTNDPKGKAIPAYLTQLSAVLSDDNSHYRVDVECMQENIEHVKKIIATQQAHAKTVEVLQAVKIEELIDDALEMITGDLEHSLFEIVRDFEPELEIESDKHSLLQMVTNFIKNAKESIIESQKPLGLIYLSAHRIDQGANVRIQITDNGVGISEENERKIFTHGFTTKPDGHGFGMHSCANAAKNLGGHLQISSEGLGKGATVTLTLPCAPSQRTKPRIKELPKETSYSRN
ncbi:GHKL domain-containing protein [Pelagicoccus sp. NFK12]|uniref:histidine kinase n=1 Tax=Pelagicoccus enzymogenes TaxID=2773457 RepID=A0A927IH52_9BACT|nr:ATP-binding protein [Pelagicoccus enzymogenes]MBD5779836.1 GHKL domain-containing protein [Pelagicoccus enzymogenes]